MAGSLDLLSASRSLTGERHFTALAGEASACCWRFEHICFVFVLVLVLVLVFVLVFVLVMQVDF